MRRIAVDAMGGDYAPEMIVRGAVGALADAEDFALVLFGDEAAVGRELEPLDYDRSRVELIHTSQTIGMGEPPMEGLRQKKDSSILQIAKKGAAKEVDAVISAGNTGAFVAACQLKMRPLAGVARPGIAVAIPSFHGPFVLCDAGANIQPKPQHLHQYGVMAGLFAQKVLGIEEPRVALLSVGEESAKGTALVKQTQELLRADGELKCVEGIAEGFLKTISAEVEQETENSEVRAALSSALQRVWARHDYSQYGGAPLIGVDGTCIICHGRSDERAIRNAVRVARQFLANGFNEAIAERFRPAGD